MAKELPGDRHYDAENDRWVSKPPKFDAPPEVAPEPVEMNYAQVMSCANCRCFDAPVPAGSVLSPIRGQCHRYPPRDGRFERVWDTDWCEEHRQRIHETTTTTS